MKQNIKDMAEKMEQLESRIEAIEVARTNREKAWLVFDSEHDSNPSFCTTLEDAKEAADLRRQCDGFDTFIREILLGRVE